MVKGVTNECSSLLIISWRRRILLLVIALLLFISLPFQGHPATPHYQETSYDIPEAYGVYSAILPSEWPWSVAHAKRLVIRSETRGYDMCLLPDKEYEELIGPAISDYVRLNDIRTWLLERTFRIDKPYDLVTSDELKTTFEHGLKGWKSFYEKYPDTGGWIELSAVGFNQDKTIAIVYMGHHCGDLCGGGNFHVLQKRDGKWVTLDWKGRSCGWAS